jgi:predicted AlkP superfamily pyrophosphatase or phosphodiesterase
LDCDENGDRRLVTGEQWLSFEKYPPTRAARESRVSPALKPRAAAYFEVSTMTGHWSQAMHRMLRPLILFSVACTRQGTSGAIPIATQAPPASAGQNQRPRLAVMVVVDQFREPYLEWYGDLFTGGFRRLLDQGRFFTNAAHDHALTETAVGHASLSTGTYPRHHGIVANEWAERTPRGWADVSNVGDSATKIVGFPTLSGVSPHYLMRTGLADWIAGADSRSQVASVSAKDRGAVLPAAHVRGQVYWFDPRAGRFVTSTYYRDRYPGWADDFTARVLPRYARDSVWTSSIPAAAASRTSPDTATWESDRVHTAFPHRFDQEGQPGRFWNWFATTPMLDAATLDYAKAMVTALGLGRDESPDFLNVSLSQTDRVGHAFGPMSREQLDNLLRLDRELGTFFTFLDQTVGVGRWVIGLSADHGALLAPETLPRPGESAAGRRATPAERATLRAIADSAALAPSDSQTRARVVASLRRLPFVAEVYTHDQLRSTSPADSFAVLERNSFYPGRAPEALSPFGVEVRYVEGWMNYSVGTTHGTPYWYDRHVPLIFMGPGVRPGRDGARAATVDFAPTLARLLGLVPPADVDGRVLPVNASP